MLIRKVMPALSANTLQNFFRGCSLLEVFVLEQPTHRISNACINVLFDSCRHLTLLGLYEGTSNELPVPLLVDDEPVLYAPYPTLARFTLEGPVLSDRGLRDILTYCSSLKTVELTDCNYVTADTLMRLGLCSSLEGLTLCRSGLMTSAAWGAVFQGCQLLKELRYTAFSINDLVEGFDEEELLLPLAADARPHTLSKLVLEGNGIVDTVLRAIFTHCTSLKDVDLSSCCQVTDDTMIALSRCCHKLVSVSLYDCVKLTPACIVALASHCTSLTDLYLRRIPVNDEVLLQLSLNCPYMHRIELQYCKSIHTITEVGIIAVAERCEQLRHLIARGCNIQLTPTIQLMNQETLYRNIEVKITD